MDNNEHLQEKAYLAGEREAELAELRDSEPPYCGACGTYLDEYGNCPAYPQTEVVTEDDAIFRDVVWAAEVNG